MRPVLFCALVLSTGSVSAQQFGIWMIGKTDNGSHYAATMNDAGGVLAKTCDADGCIWVMTVKANCESHALYPALLSASSGAYPLKLQCAPNPTSSGRYVIQEFEIMENAVKEGAQLGMGMPLQSDEFRVAMYAISGWSSASTQLAPRVSVMLRRPGEENL